MSARALDRRARKIKSRGRINAGNSVKPLTTTRAAVQYLLLALRTISLCGVKIMLSRQYARARELFFASRPVFIAFARPAAILFFFFWWEGGALFCVIMLGVQDGSCECRCNLVVFRER